MLKAQSAPFSADPLNTNMHAFQFIMHIWLKKSIALQNDSVFVEAFFRFRFNFMSILEAVCGAFGIIVSNISLFHWYKVVFLSPVNFVLFSKLVYNPYAKHFELPLFVKAATQTAHTVYRPVTQNWPLMSSSIFLVLKWGFAREYAIHISKNKQNM